MELSHKSEPARADGGTVSAEGQSGSQEFLSRSELEILSRAGEVIGDRSAAMRWLGTPVRALDDATPISLRHTPEGREAVLSALGRLEHGVL